MTDAMEAAARALCKSGRFETGQGTCALLCMDQLGDARKGCRHVTKIHGKLAQDIVTAHLASLSAGAPGVVRKLQNPMRQVPHGDLDEPSAERDMREAAAVILALQAEIAALKAREPSDG